MSTHTNHGRSDVLPQCTPNESRKRVLKIKSRIKNLKSTLGDHPYFSEHDFNVVEEPIHAIDPRDDSDLRQADN